MAITTADLKFFQSERMTDNTDGGGRMSSVEIVSGTDNMIFDDLSDVDRAVGDVSIRKVYATVTSANTDKYLDAGVVVFKEPADPALNVVTFSTGGFFDTHTDLKNKLEQSVTRSSRWSGYFWGAHYQGQRAVTLWQRMTVEMPDVGSRFELVSLTNSVVTSEFIWITRVSSRPRSLSVPGNSGNVIITVNEVQLEIAEPLVNNYGGTDVQQNDFSSTAAQGQVYTTRYNADSVALFGISPTTESAAPGEYIAKVESIYSKIIPTAFTETALADVTPGGDRYTVSPTSTGSSTLTTSLNLVKPDGSMYLGRACMPGSLTLTGSGVTITDSGGVLKSGSTIVGDIDYGNGVLRFTASCPSLGTAPKTVMFTPAVKSVQPSDSASISVTASNRGFVWVASLLPIPDKATLTASYRASGQWYSLVDDGTAFLRGVDPSYGVGSLNRDTGTVTLTTGAMPDVDSEIVFSWVSTAATVSTGSTSGPKLRFEINYELQHERDVNLSYPIEYLSWTYNGTSYSINTDVSSVGGQLLFDGNKLRFFPVLLPGKGTVATIHYSSQVVRDVVTPTHVYDKVGTSEEFTAVIENDGFVRIQLIKTPLVAGTRMEIKMEVKLQDESQLSDDYFVVFDPDWVINFSSDNLFGLFSSLNTTTGDLAFTPGHHLINCRVSRTTYTDGTVNGVPDKIATHYIYYEDKYVVLKEGSIIKVTYFKYSDATIDITTTETVSEPHTETFIINEMCAGLDKRYGEKFIDGSLNVHCGSDTYIDYNGVVNKNFDVSTGMGTVSGSMDAPSGKIILTEWTAGVHNLTDIYLNSVGYSLLSDVGASIDHVVFRTPVAPIKPGSLQITYKNALNVVKNKTIDSTGILQDPDCFIHVDFEHGLVKARFGEYVAPADLTTEEKAKSWYDPDIYVIINGTTQYWVPILVLSKTIRYNAVAHTFLSPDSALLGINAARLPPDGKALIFNSGRLVLVHHTTTHAESTLSPSQVIDCGRTRLYRVEVEDTNSKRLPASAYTVNRTAGTVAMSPSLDLTGYTGPYAIHHTVGDLSRIVRTDINGTLHLQKALSHTYPADDSRVSGVLFSGTLQARYTSLFVQSSWTSVWSDVLIGSAPLANYNDAAYPIHVSNACAYSERFLIKFTSSTAFQIIGEQIGYIGVGVIGEDCSPVNLLTNAAYFTIDYRGWGSGWATGNCLRFNTVGAIFPVDLIRSVQPSEPTGLSYNVELLLIGNVDA